MVTTLNDLAVGDVVTVASLGGEWIVTETEADLLRRSPRMRGWFAARPKTPGRNGQPHSGTYLRLADAARA